MDALLRQFLEQNGGQCPFPDTDPDIWIAPDGQLGRVVLVTEADPATESEANWVFVPVVRH